MPKKTSKINAEFASKEKPPRKSRKGIETPAAARAKQIYLELGPERRHYKVVDILKKPVGYIRQIEEWSRKFGWVEAAKAYDIELVREEAKQYREKLDKEIKLMNEHQATIAKGLFVKVSKRLQELLDSDDPKEKLWGRDAVALFKNAAELERLARGAATEHVATDVTSSDGTVQITANFGTGAIESEEDKV